jgi:tetratricopeptide (TPR) repeat protein
VRKILFVIAFFLCLSAYAMGQEGGGRYIDEKMQMGLADSFFQEGDYYRAITEYKRFLFFFPQSLRAEEALWKIASSYFHGKKWDEALSAADDLLKTFPASFWVPEALLLKGRCWAEKKEYSQARYFFRRVEEVPPEKAVAGEAQWQIALSYVKEEKWKEAAIEFRKVNPTSKLYPQADFFAQGLGRIDEVPQKSPTEAGILAALLPGAGHLYSERYRDAAIAFALNGAFIWGMVEAFEHKNYVVGGILTFFELGWYSGNIYSAVSSAHKYNRNKKKEYLNQLEKEGNFSAGISFHDKYPILSFRYVF